MEGKAVAPFIARSASILRGPGQGHRARAGPPQRWRPPARLAQPGESGGKAHSASGVCLLYARPMMEAVAMSSSSSANDTLPDTA